MMTLKEAILQALEDIATTANYLAVYNHIVEKKYYNFDNQKTPAQTVSAQLGQFLRDGDTRVGRILLQGNTYTYYLTRNAPNIDLDNVSSGTETPTEKSITKSKGFEERDLHKLLSSFLKKSNTFSKTIFHEKSLNRKDSNQVWTHPDMIGVRFPSSGIRSQEHF